MRFADFYPFYLSQRSNRTRRRPTHPLYSFMGGWVMCNDVLTGRIRF